MSSNYMLMQLINHIFESQVGTSQNKKPASERVGLAVTMSLDTDYGNEEGYRHADMVIYASTNYVSVYTRTRANVAPLDEDGNLAGDYEKSATEWELKCRHDSCYRDAIEGFFREHDNAGPLQHCPFNGGFMYPYTVVPRKELVEAGIELPREYDID